MLLGFGLVGREASAPPGQQIDFGFALLSFVGGEGCPVSKEP